MTRFIRASFVLTILLVAGLAAYGAHGMQSLRVVERHPTAENIPEVADPRFILHEDEETVFLAEDSYETVTIGVEDGGYEEMFGEVADIAAMDDGTFLVLDSEASEVRMFDYDGSFLGLFGGPGEGPGEFRGSVDQLSVSKRGDLVFAVGFGSHLITAHERQGRAAFAPLLSFPKALNGEAGCVMNGYFWFYGYSPAVKGVLHKYSFDGEREASFLDFYMSPREYISHRMSRQGTVACSEDHGVVALNRVNAPVVTGYNENGERVWQVRFADFDPMQYVEYTGPGWGCCTDEPGQARITSLFSDSAGDFYVQYTVMEENGDPATRDHGPLFRIDARTGEGAYVGRAPPILDIDGDYAFAASNFPFPRVVIHKRKPDSD